VQKAPILYLVVLDGDYTLFTSRKIPGQAASLPVSQPDPGHPPTTTIGTGVTKAIRRHRDFFQGKKITTITGQRGNVGKLDADHCLIKVRGVRCCPIALKRAKATG
jgi:hypothetical protein